MKRDEPENLDLLAAEYVIGTLRAGARRSFERRQRRDPFVARRVSAWEERFAQLSLRLVPIAPSPEVWAAIPSPDGQMLAIAEAGGSKNVWQIENF